MDAPRPTKDFAKVLRRRLSLPEALLWRAIKGRQLDGLHFRRQHPAGPYVLDFYCDQLRLAVEVDGDGHAAGDQPGKDAARDAWLAEQGIRTLRLSARSILENPDGAAQRIAARANLDAPPQGELSRSD